MASAIPLFKSFENSILWDNSDSTVADYDVWVEGLDMTIQDSDFSAIYLEGATIDYSHCIHIDPQFADPVNGDFHLKSPDGRWNGSSWVTTDTVYSKCLAHGWPSASYSNEPSPNGGQINMGAYGNTNEASKVDSSNLNSINVSASIMPDSIPGPNGAKWKLSYEQVGTWHTPYSPGGFTMEGLVSGSYNGILQRCCRIHDTIAKYNYCYRWSDKTAWCNLLALR